MKREPSGFLACESRAVFLLMILAGGWFGGFTYTARGGVFCNAQTGNVLLLGMALGHGRWQQALYYLIPISAYILGAFVSELLPGRVRRAGLRWDTVLVMGEMAAVIVLGFIPDSAPVQITQVTVNFLCSMQYNTFRQAEGVPMATTFCTNHVRQVGIALSKLVGAGGARRAHLGRLGAHLAMIGAFVVGAAVSTALSLRLGGRAVWGALIPLGLALIRLLRADLVTEKGRLEQVPHGH